MTGDFSDAWVVIGTIAPLFMVTAGVAYQVIVARDGTEANAPWSLAFSILASGAATLLALAALTGIVSDHRQFTAILGATLVAVAVIAIGYWASEGSHRREAKPAPGGKAT